jgi:hypothetical protein
MLNDHHRKRIKSPTNLLRSPHLVVVAPEDNDDDAVMGLHEKEDIREISHGKQGRTAKREET